MKYVAAYLLASLGGNESPTAKDIEKILSAAGLDVDAGNAKTVVEALSGKNVEDVIGAGQKKLASVPTGAPAAATPAAAGATPGGAAAADKAAPAAKKEEKKEESEEEDMGFGLFD